MHLMALFSKCWSIWNHLLLSFKSSTIFCADYQWTMALCNKPCSIWKHILRTFKYSVIFCTECQWTMALCNKRCSIWMQLLKIYNWLQSRFHHQNTHEYSINRPDLPRYDRTFGLINCDVRPNKLISFIVRHIESPTCSAHRGGRCCAAVGSLVCSCPGRSRRERWSVFSSRRRPGLCRHRRAGHSCTVCRLAQRTAAGLYGSAFDCSLLASASARAAGPVSAHVCRWRCSWSADACSFHSGCRLWLHPGRGCRDGWGQCSVAGLY